MDNSLIPKQTLTPGNGGFEVKTTDLLDPITFKKVIVQNGFVPPDLYTNWGNDDVGPLLLYTFANDSLKRVKDFLLKNKVPTPINKNGKIIFDNTKMIKLNFYVEGAHRVIGNPGDGKLTRNQLIEKYGRNFSQWYTYEKDPAKSAKPGSSNHGFWRSIDIYQSTDGSTENQKIVRTNDSWKGPQDQFQAWFQQNGPAYGWFSVLMPEYKADATPKEPWHFEYFYDKDPFVQSKIDEFERKKRDERWAKEYMAKNANKPYKDPSQLNSATNASNNVTTTLENISNTITNFFK